MTLRTVFLLALLTGFAAALNPTYAQTARNVSFLHGIGSDATIWNDVIAHLNAHYLINPRANTYDSNLPIPSIASQHGPGLVAPNSAVVASSMGGLVAREMVRQGQTGAVSALVTTGTPHTGAGIANAISAGNHHAVINWWTGDLAAGWWAFYLYNYPVATHIAQNFLSAVFGVIADVANPLPSLASWNDLKVGSPFIQTINQGGGSNPYHFPAPHYTIFGAEHWNTHWRLANAIPLNYALQGLYLYMGAYASYLANDYYWLYQQTYYFPYYDEYIRLSAAADAFFWGWLSLNQVQQSDWSTWMTFSRTHQGWFYEDGIVAEYSQAPGYVPTHRRLMALGVNHRQLTTSAEGINRIDHALRQPDINLPRRNPSGPGPGGPGGPGPGGPGGPDNPNCMIPEAPCPPIDPDGGIIIL